MSLRGLRERHIDHVLAEELESSQHFSAWFVERVLGDRVPASEPHSCVTEISHYRGNGETDILLRYQWGSGQTAVVHFEDKLGAVPQPRQAERYAEAVDAEPLLAPVLW